ncbi:MAG: hypothetical protein HeimC2_00100 [Candidatus Heimdallarchaeota archaeon LC_2]|nr:MAG: hypothetical protein HeimC2_00100 [Candidatus Heimdallarchaeota archaeon LC_2]
MSFTITKRNLSVIGISVLLIISGSIATILISNNTQSIDLGNSISNYEQEAIKYNGSLSADFSITQQDFYKGNNIPFSLEVHVEETIARLNYISIGIVDLEMNRTADQHIIIDELYNPGTHLLNLELRPGFEENGFVALTNQNYTLTSYVLIYTQVHIVSNFTASLEHNLFGYLAPIYEQATNLNWFEPIEINASIITTQNKLTVTSTKENASASIGAEIETTGYTRIYYNLTGLVNSSLQIGIEGDILTVNDDFGYFQIGNYQGKHNLTIFFNITDNENISLEISIPTQKIAILTVIANDNWENLTGDELKFREPSFYLDQVNSRFSSTMNLTFVEVAVVEFEMRISTISLELMRSFAGIDVGEKLLLNNSIWDFGVGTQTANAGADILLILSNRTMTNLGVVFSNQNTAIAVQGSQNTGNTAVELRLTPSFADNLIQHELSHIFHAPDRWTETDEASIMSKSRPDDFILDFVFDSFWLRQITWLEVDIQTMVDNTSVFQIQN